jgi:RHS repeat-associated protein
MMKVVIIGMLSILCLAPSAGWAQFNPVKPSSAGGTPIPPGSIAYPGQNPTTQFNGQAFITPFGPGTTALGAYDAVAWFKITDAAPNYGVPTGWVGTTSTMGYCHPQAGGSLWWVQLIWPPGGTGLDISGGTPCESPSPVPIASRLAIHYVGQPNGPEQPADPPVEFKASGDGYSCAGDPCDTKTGLYYQTDTDITVPDVTPITMTRTYRTKDTASRVFGIGASHPYDQYMLRDDLCTAARVILPDGAYIHFTRTSGTNCLNATLQHASTQTAFYAATMAWDQVFQRYRLKFKDGTEWRFSEYGALVAMLDRNGNATTLTRALDGGLTGNLTKITSPSGRYLTLTYDAANRITQATDILGRQIVYTYDGSGRLWKVTNAAGGIAEYTYDAGHRLLTLKEPGGNIHVTNTFDANGRVATQTQADGTTYQFAYTLDGNGNVTQTDVTDPRGIIKRFVFNSAGLTATITDAVGQPESQTTTYEWQANTNLLLSVTDALNRKTAYTYDAKGNTLTVTKLATTANAVTTTFTYEPVFNQVATVTDPLNHTTTFAYDAKVNLTTITNALNKTTTITVNNAGQPLTIKDSLNNITTFTYELGDLVKIKDPLNRETQRILDAAGRLRNVTNPLGQKTLYTPDALDRITQLVDAINGATAFTYDANSNLLTVTDAKSQQTVYTYNNMNRTATRKDPLLKTETYTYDNNGNIATVTDRKSQVTTYTYDLLNRKTKATYQDGTSTNYTYDAGNRLTQIQEKDAGNTVTATITRTYDGLDRLTQEVTAQGTLTYTYDNANRRATMTVAGQPTVNYTYDNANRLTQITQGANLVTIGYDDADRRASLTLPNGNSVVYAYNAASELLSLTYKQGATVIGDLTYTYDAAGNRIKQGGSFARSTIPPALATASYNVNNQQTTFGTNTLTYDFNGNLQTVTDAGGTATYSWNARNQLAGISATGFAASFSYDSFGRRTGKTIQGTTTNFVYDGLNPVQEKAGATVTANLLTGLGIDEFLTRTDGVGTSALLSDALGSTVALGDGTGTLQTQYTYEPFGYASQTGAANTNSYKYTGREDDGSGLYYYRARYYHPRLQRFIGEDPLGFGGRDANLYGYVGENPLAFVDPTGEFGIIGGAIGAGVEVGIQAFKNYVDGCDVFNADNYDWWDVGASAFIGAASAGWFDVGKTAWKSGGAIGNLSGQLDRARTAGKAAKIQGRIQNHQSQIADAFIIQGAWQGVKELLKQLNGPQSCRCN